MHAQAAEGVVGAFLPRFLKEATQVGGEKDAVPQPRPVAASGRDVIPLRFSCPKEARDAGLQTQ